MDNLMGQWYNSLSSGVPAYSVYESPYYFCETWLCWNGRPAFWRKIENNTVLHFTDA